MVLPTQNSMDLVDAAKRGDENAVNALMRVHLPGLRVYVRSHMSSLLRVRESQSDLVQTICREALVSLEDYEWQGEGSFRYWLFSLAMHKMQKKQSYHLAAKRNINRVTDLEAEESLLAAEASPSQHAMAKETSESLEAALDCIPEQYREVVLLSRVVGLSNQEIAERLGKSEGSTRVLLSRALSRLMTEMERLGQSEGS